jgi:hypothetical protein
VLELQKPEAIRKEGVSSRFAACALLLFKYVNPKAQQCMLNIHHAMLS